MISTNASYLPLTASGQAELVCIGVRREPRSRPRTLLLLLPRDRVDDSGDAADEDRAERGERGRIGEEEDAAQCDG